MTGEPPPTESDAPAAPPGPSPWDRALAWAREHSWALAVGSLGLLLVVLIVALVAVLGGGDGAETPAGTVAPATTATVAAGAGSVTTVPSTSAPTGTEPSASPGSTLPPSDLPPLVVAVKIDNAPAARPQVGIDAADLLIETMVEGGLTRFTALYSADNLPALVGPVRSLRPVDAELLALFRPVVLSTGGQPFVTGAVAAAGARLATPRDSAAFQRLERPSPHDLFAAPAISLEEQGTPEAGPLPWVTGPWPGGDTGETVTIPFSASNTIEWRFEGGRYLRYEDGAPVSLFQDAGGTKVPFERDVLVLLFVARHSAGYTDGNGVDVPTFDVIGSGRVLVYAKGEKIEGTWTRSAQVDPYLFADAGGDPLPIPGGRVYLGIVPRELDVGS